MLYFLSEKKNPLKYYVVSVVQWLSRTPHTRKVSGLVPEEIFFLRIDTIVIITIVQKLSFKVRKKTTPISHFDMRMAIVYRFCITI